MTAKEAICKAGLATAFAVAAIAAPAQATGFSVSGDVSGTGGDASAEQVAVNASNDAAFAWIQDAGGTDEVKARLRTDNELGTIEHVSDIGDSTDDPAIAIEPHGDAVVAWERTVSNYSVIEARTVATDGTLGPIHTVSTNTQLSATNPSVAVDDAGNAVVAWNQSAGWDSEVMARTLSASGALGPAVLAVSTPGVDASLADVGYDANGVATIAYGESDGTYMLATARTLSATGVLGTPKTLSAAPYSAHNLDMAIEDDGDKVFVWDQIVGSDTLVLSRTLSATGGLGQNIETLSSTGVDAYYPEVGVDDDGDAVATWLRVDAPDYQVQARTRSADGTLGGSILTLSQPGRAAGAPDVAVAANGIAVFAWARADANGDGRIKTRKLYEDGTLTDTSPITDSGDADDPHVGIGDRGTAVMAWENDDDIEYYASCCATIDERDVSNPPTGGVITSPIFP